MSRTLFLHVGVAKTGTTYLQRILFANRALLKSHDYLYPGAKSNAHFLASMDLRDAGFAGETYAAAAGQWPALVEEVNRFSGKALISHETLARARRPVIKEAVDAFDTDDVRVVLTARDLARQIPAVWQESLKNRTDESYSEFLETILHKDLERRGDFWMPQNLVALTRRWSEMVGADNVTLVTVPPTGTDTLELWRRFAVATELPDLDYNVSVQSQNSSLGTAEAELLRRILPKLPESLGWFAYQQRIKRLFAEYTLAPLDTLGRIPVPEEAHDEVRRISDRAISLLGETGCRVVGDLEDLRPRLNPPEGPTPDEVTESQLLDLSLDVLSKLVVRPHHGAMTTRGAARFLVKRLKEKVRRRG